MRSSCIRVTSLTLNNSIYFYIKIRLILWFARNPYDPIKFQRVYLVVNNRYGWQTKCNFFLGFNRLNL